VPACSAEAEPCTLVADSTCAQRAQDYCVGRHAAASPDKKHHGVHPHAQQGLQPEQVHLHSEHHPRRGGPHAGVSQRATREGMFADRVSTQVHKSLQRIRERKLANFIEWGPASIQVRFLCYFARATRFGITLLKCCRWHYHGSPPTCSLPTASAASCSPITPGMSCPTALMLFQHLTSQCSIRHLFTRCVTQFDKLFRRKAFIDNYEAYSMFKARHFGRECHRPRH